ncbi:SH3 domain-containing protein [Oscillatoria sp. FACHB-1406]|uniref:SH3 domain-containing protein n=1 Tax=Oscillatoria sp. FACHB-1406 TaxID=2692846 RepID=UPI0019CCE10F|nr:SH3 domain-containing protein [Oscillatoria sp. FACHB-1406]MBD2577566.1 SH3 domain-containing protein [Oscillatoria sp. FACHB-1406]
MSLALIAGFGLNLQEKKLSFSPVSPAQANSCDTVIRNVSFSGRTSGSMTGKPNIYTMLRASTSTSASILMQIPPNTLLNFSGWTYGQGITDIWTGNTDYRWFRVTYNGQTGWVASGVIYGNPPNSSLVPNCPQPGSGMYGNPEAFYRWAKGQTGITRLDGLYSLRGQCVTLIARYIQEVYLPANQRSISLAFGNGKDTARFVSQMLPAQFSPTTTVGLPKRGAIISFPTIGIFNGITYGHVAIVMENRTLNNGQRQVRIMDSNGDSKGVNSTVVDRSTWINIPNGTAQGYGTGIYWTNPR